MRGGVAIAVLGAVAGCGGAPVAPKRGSVLPHAVAVAKQEPVRWVLGRARALGVAHALALPDGAMLVPGPEGQRWISRGGSLEHSATLLPEEIAAVLDGPDGTFEFVGASGTIFRTHTPLGPAFETRAPAERFDSVTVSREAIVGIRDGGLFRSVDRGASYAEVSSVDRPGRAENVVLARDGRGLLLMRPQRLFATRDHGASWAKLPLPDGSSQLSVADDGVPFLGAPAGARRLLPDGKGLAPAVALPSVEKWLWDDPGSPIEAIAMFGQTVVTVARGGVTAPRASVSKLADRRVFRAIDGLANCDRVQASVAGDHVAVACVTAGASPGMRVARSYDDGGTWRISAPYALHAPDQAQFAFAAGPKGALLFAGPKGPTLVATEDAPLKVLVPDGSVPVAAQFDAAGGRVLFATSDSYVTELFTAALDGSERASRGKFRATCVRAAIDLRAGGGLRAGCVIKDTYRPGGQYLFSLRALSNETLSEWSRWWGREPEFALGGGRGLVADNGNLLEGSWGVESLVPIGVAPAGPFACSDAGCAFPSASRIGWNAPVVGFGGGALTLERREKPWKRPPLKLQCATASVTNSVTTHAFGELDLTTGSDVSYRVVTPTGMATATWAKPVLQPLSFFKPSSTAQAIHHDLPNGFLSLRYRVLEKAAAGKPPLIAADVAWRRSGMPKVKTVSLGTIGRFVIDEGSAQATTDGWPWTAGVVDGGAIVRPTHPYLRAYDADVLAMERAADFDGFGAKEEWTGSEPFYFVTDAGKISKVLPPKHWLRRAVVYRGASRWFVVSTQVKKDGTVAVEVSSDALGSSWEQRNVRLWTPGSFAASYTLTEVDGRPAFAIVPAQGSQGLIAILATDGSHDVDVRTFELPPLELAHACKATTGELARATIRVPFGLDETVSTDLGDKMYVSEVSLSIAHTGAACVDALTAFGRPTSDSLDSLLIPLRDLTRAVVFREKSTLSAQCVVVP